MTVEEQSGRSQPLTLRDEIARELFESHHHDPFALRDEALSRMRLTESLYISQLFDTRSGLACFPRRAHKQKQLDQARRDGIAVTFLYHDRVAQAEGRMVPTINLATLQARTQEMRAEERIDQLGRENLPPDEAKKLRGKRFMLGSFFNVDRELRELMAMVLRNSDLYKERVASKQVFVAALLEVDHLLRPRTTTPSDI